MSDIDAIKQVVEVSFEHDFGESPPRLWRVRCFREFGERQHAYSEWFATEDAANAAVARLTSRGATEIRVTEYEQKA